MAPTPAPSTPPVAWTQVLVAATLLLLNGLCFLALGLQLTQPLFIASLRCFIQLSLLGLVLEDIFHADNVLLVLGLTLLLATIASYETVYHKVTTRHPYMIFSVLISMYISTLVVASIGSKYAFLVEPFWSPQKFIPIVGMLLGNTMAGIAVGTNICLNQLWEGKDRIEFKLAFGASKWEAVRPVLVESLRLAMLPTINAMSVMGLISIPGMMTGQILNGANVMDAVKYQQIMMYLVSTSTALGTVASVLICIHVCFDEHHRLQLHGLMRR